MKVFLNEGEEIVVASEDTDLEFTIRFDSDGVRVFTPFKDNSGRSGCIFESKFIDLNAVMDALNVQRA